MDAPVQGHSCQREDAGVHGEEDDEVHDFARRRAEHPLIQGVDGGLEGHAEDDEAQVGYPEVKDEQVGGLGVDLAAPEQNREDQTVPDGAEQEDEREAQRDEHRLRSPGGRVQRREVHLHGASTRDSRAPVSARPQTRTARADAGRRHATDSKHARNADPPPTHNPTQQSLFFGLHFI